MMNQAALLALALSLREKSVATIERAAAQARLDWPEIPFPPATTDFVNYSQSTIYPYQPICSYGYRYSSDAETSEIRVRQSRHCIAQELIMPDGGAGKVATSGWTPAIMLMSPTDADLWYKRSWYYYAFDVAEREWRYKVYKTPQAGGISWSATGVDIPFVYPAMMDRSNFGWPDEYDSIGIEAAPANSVYFPVITPPVGQFDMDFDCPVVLNHKYAMVDDETIDTQKITCRVGIGLVAL